MVLRWLAGRGGKSKLVATDCLFREFNITPIDLIATSRRIRLYRKAPTLKSWLSDLVENPVKSIKRSWVTGTTSWLNRFGPKGWCELPYSIIVRKLEIERENRRLASDGVYYKRYTTNCYAETAGWFRKFERQLRAV